MQWDVITTDPLQFSFKKNITCADVISTLKSAVKYFTDNGSSVYTASLDIRKAFDTVNYFKMYESLLSAGIPVVIVDVLCEWYGKLCFAVTWNNAISTQFIVGSRVRQWSCLSPAIFKVFMNVFIVELRKLNLSCHVYGIFLGCLLYADDIIGLLSPSVEGLQGMLNRGSKCFEISHILFLCSFMLRNAIVWLLVKCTVQGCDNSHAFEWTGC